MSEEVKIAPSLSLWRPVVLYTVLKYDDVIMEWMYHFTTDSIDLASRSYPNTL